MPKNAIADAGRFRVKKRINMVLCALIFALGVSSYLVSVYTDAKGDFLSLFRFMTINGTLLTSGVSLGTLYINFLELRLGAELYSRAAYLLRLSAAVTECVIAIVIFLSLLPFIPDSPNIMKFDSFNMHVILPALTIASFVLDGLPVERLRRRERFSGALPITVYAAVMVPLILLGMIPKERIPYSFMKFGAHPVWYSLLFAAMVYLLAYLLTLALSRWNRRARRLWTGSDAPAAVPQEIPRK